MKNNKLKLANTLMFLLTLNIGFLHAQKLNDVQEGNLLVTNIKLDGKANDWSSPLKALNKRTGLAYTVANDDKKLYIIIQASEVNTTRKILMGGITFSITDAKKKNDLASLTYPVITSNSRRAAMGGGAGGQRSFGSYQTMTQQQRDSMQNAFGQRQLLASKDIKIYGLRTVTDTLISIYNEYSIKAMASLDSTGTYTYEIGIPLELLPVDTGKEFGYNIKINGLQMSSFGGGSNSNRNGGGADGGRPTGNFSGGGSSGGGRNGIDFQDLVTPTDFSGKYILAK